MADFKEVMVHYLTQGGKFGDTQEAENAVDEMLKAASDMAIDRLRDDGLAAFETLQSYRDTECRCAEADCSHAGDAGPVSCEHCGCTTPFDENHSSVAASVAEHDATVQASDRKCAFPP